MKRILFIAKSAADEIRRGAASFADEDGGGLIGCSQFGDVWAYAHASADTKRSAVIVHLRGADLEREARRLLEEHPGGAWVGHAHSHDRLDSLSAGDLAQLSRLHQDPRAPAFGIVALLAVKNGSSTPRLRGWLSRRHNVIEELDLYEVDDPRTARARHPAWPLQARRAHALSSDVGARRFERELEELGRAGYTVAATTTERGVELRLRDDALRGELVVTMGSEGWEGIPRVALEQGKTSSTFITPMTSLGSVWSSAFSLADLVEYLRKRHHWPKRTTLTKATTPTNAKKESSS